METKFLKIRENLMVFVTQVTQEPAARTVEEVQGAHEVHRRGRLRVQRRLLPLERLRGGGECSMRASLEAHASAREVHWPGTTANS